MTTHSRRVLEDCKYVYERLDVETDDRQWRIYWVAAVALLRAVGHVLEKVDGQDESVRLASRKIYSEWKSNQAEHEIFREFIENERNSILKEYSLGVSEGPIALHLTIKQGDEKVVDEVAVLEENVYRPMIGGFYDGEDGRTLIEMAIEWWEVQLSRIDELVK